MKYEDLFIDVVKLKIGSEKLIYKEGGSEIYITRPSKLSSRFKEYDLKKNFQIWLKENNRKFRPNHLRVLIDLNLRIRKDLSLKTTLLHLFDNIYYHKDPDKIINQHQIMKFGSGLNSINIIAILTQLFIIEQEYCYYKESRYDPPTLFFQGWIREFICSPKEIDNLCMSVCRGQPPKTEYTCKENKKNKKYELNLRSLWYYNKE
jgi:hypothetical protein